MEKRKTRIKRTECSTFKHLCDRHRLDYLWDEKDESGRPKRGITIAEMAKKLGFIGKNGKGQESKLSQYENRREGPPLELVEKYAECFGLKGKAKFDLFYEALNSSEIIRFDACTINPDFREQFLQFLTVMILGIGTNNDLNNWLHEGFLDYDTVIKSFLDAIEKSPCKYTPSVSTLKTRTQSEASESKL
jgi:transcriptional regulator with XRE-family HTH domain